MEPSVALPSELWTKIFGYLSTADRSSVRASCKRFKRLVDHCSLWTGWSAVLDAKAPYNSQFWATLRRRRVASVLVRRSSRDKELRLLASSLPEVSTLVMELCPAVKSSCLQGFLNLRRVAIRSSCISHLLDASAVCRPELLTHLSLCDVKMSHQKNFISDISHFTNLVSLVLHETETYPKLFQTVNCLRAQHPKLEHLSLSGHKSDFAPPSPMPGPQEPTWTSLSSFELIDAVDHLLPVDAMKTMPDLKSLAVFYRELPRRSQELQRLSGTCMERWLSDLRHLSTLTIVNGPEVKTYVGSIPPTVTSLTLCVPVLSPEDMAAVALQVPNLLHLYIDLWPSHLGSRTAQIPQLFPKLRTLKLGHEYVLEKYFLELVRLQDLEILEVRDSHQHFPEIAEKLRVLTNYRLKVMFSPHQRAVMSCPCVSWVY